MYRTEIVTVTKKQLPVHKAEVKDDTKVQESPEAVNKFKEELSKTKISSKVEDDIRNEIISLATKL